MSYHTSDLFQKQDKKKYIKIIYRKYHFSHFYTKAFSVISRDILCNYTLCKTDTTWSVALSSIIETLCNVFNLFIAPTIEKSPHVLLFVGYGKTKLKNHYRYKHFHLWLERAHKHWLPLSFCTCSDWQVFEAALAWVKREEFVRQEFLPDLMVKVRLPLLTPQFLSDRVASEELVKSSHKCR